MSNNIDNLGQIMANSANLTSTNSLRDPQAPLRTRGIVPNPITYAPDQTYKYQSTNYSAKVNNVEFLNALIKQIQQKLNRVVTGHEKMFIINKVRNIDPRLIIEHPKDILLKLSRMLSYKV